MSQMSGTSFDRESLTRALAEADIVPLLMVLVHLTADEEMLDQARPYIEGPWDFQVRMPAALQAIIRERAAAALQEYSSEAVSTPPCVSTRLLKRMMSVCVGEEIPEEYLPLIRGLLGIDTIARDFERPASVVRDDSKSRKVLIIGAGMSGLCMAVKLRRAGIPFEIIEKNPTVGGTWYENRYPGCGVDTPNHIYSFSFEPNHEWSRYFSKQEELWDYFERCADKYDVRRHIQFNREVTSAVYDEERAIWRLTVKCEDGSEIVTEADILIAAVGQLNRPFIPAITGLEKFQGHVFHTAQWDHRVSLDGRRVGMIGTGASGMQAAPSIAEQVGKLVIFQRTPHWAIHNPTYHAEVSEGMKWTLKHVPFYARWYRFQLFWASGDLLHAALQIDPEWANADLSINATNELVRRELTEYIKSQIGDDPELLKKVIPQYPPYGKRMLRDNHWYKMLTRANVELVTQSIEKITESAVVTKDGNEFPLDVIILATGFQAGKLLSPMEIRGRDGCNLREIWGEDDPRAYLGITVPHFPNFFILYGPNTNLGHGGSGIFHSECQSSYIVQCIEELVRSGNRSLECRQDVHDAYNRRVDAAHNKMVWSHRLAGTWYKNKAGRVFANSPWRLVDYWNMTRRMNPDDFLFETPRQSHESQRGTVPA